MATNVDIPKGWELVERMEWFDKANDLLVEDRNHPGTPYRELFVRKKRAPGDESAKDDLYLRELKLSKEDTHIETSDVVRTKEVAILVLMPLYLIGKCVRDIFSMIASVVVDLKDGHLWCAIKDVGGFVWGKVRDPFFAVAVFACALFGLYSPFEGREQIARIERKWHYVDDLRDPKTRIHYFACQSADLDATDKEGVPILFSRHYYFPMAYCFQPHGSSNDPRYVVRSIKC